MRALVVVGVVFGFAQDAAADYSNDLKRIEGRLKQTAPARGVDKAPLGPPGWCGPLTESPYTGGVDGHLGQYYEYPTTKFWAVVGAAQALCKNDPKAPVIHRFAQEVLQIWMNNYGLSAADAVESIKLTIDKDRNESAQRELCKALALDAEVGGAERAFQMARRDLFECTGSSSDSITTMGGNMAMVRLVPWLDSSAQPADELVRLAYVSREALSFASASARYREERLLGYMIWQLDARTLDTSKALAALDQASYKSNIYARVTIKEKIGRTRLAMLELDDLVKEKTGKDADWKELLLTAPQRGYEEWTAAAAKYKAELQRSAEFEQAAFGPSRRALAGCAQKLKPDLAGVLKPLKRETADELKQQMNSHPVAGLLFRRYQACVAGDGDKMAAQEMRGIQGLRVIRGPRAAAYYAALDALGKIRADRTKFPIKEQELPFDRNDILENLTHELAQGGNPGGYSVWQEKGVVKSVKKGKDELNVVFATDKQKVWSQTCKQLNRIVMFAHDGRPIYDQSCTGQVITADLKPKPINVPLSLADGVAAGRFVSFGVSNSAERRVSMPFEVYADKQGKKLVSWYGIQL
jgi:hypothetical protein